MEETMEEAHPYVVFPGMIPPAYLASQLPFPAPLPLDGPGVGAPSTSIHSILRNDAHVTPHSLAVVGDMLASVHARTNGLRIPNAVPFSGVNANSASTPRVISALMQQRPGVLDAIARERNTEVRGMQRNNKHTNQMSTDQSSHLSHENVHVQQSQRQHYQQQQQHPQMKQEGGSHRDMQQRQPQKQQQQHGYSAGPHSRYNNGGETAAGESGYRPSSADYRGSHTGTHNQTHAHAHHHPQNYSNSTTNTHASAPVYSGKNVSLKHDPNNPRVIHTVKQERPPQPHDRHSRGVHAPAVRSEVLGHTNTHAKHHKYPRDLGNACMLGAIREQQGVSPGYGPNPVPITIPPELEQVTAEFRPANAYVENHAPHKQVHSAHGAREDVQPVDKEEEGRQMLQKGLKRDQAHMKGTHQTPQKPSKSAKLGRRTSSSKKRDANFDGTRSGVSTPRKPPQEKTHVRDNSTPGSKSFGSIKKRVEAVISSDSMRYAETGDMADFRSLPRKSLTELRLQLTLQSAVLHRIAVDDLSQLVYLMDRHITAKREVKLNSDSSDHDFEEVLVGLEAAHIILTLVTAPSIPIEIYIEDYLTNALHFVKHHITKTLFRPHHNTDASEPKQSKKKPSANSAPKINAHAQRQISTLYTRLCVVMERFCNLLSLQNCTDEFLLEITTLALNSFTYAPDDLCVRTIDLAELQGISLHLVCTVTRRYHRHRENVMYDILMFLNKLTTAKKNLRTYRYEAKGGTQHTSMFMTALVVRVIQSFTADQSETAVVKESDEQVKTSDGKITEANAIRAYESAVATASDFLSKFFRKASTKQEGEVSIKEIFMNFLEDLLGLLNIPEWPAADMLLSRIVLIMFDTLSGTKVDAMARGFALDCIGTIAKQLKAQTDGVSVAALMEIIRERQATSESTEDELAHCVCGKGYSGEFMLECDGGCRKWYHGSCVGVPPTYSGEWLCKVCTDHQNATDHATNDIRSKESFQLQTYLSAYLKGTHTDATVVDQNSRNARNFYHAQWVVAVQKDSALPEKSTRAELEFLTESVKRRNELCTVWSTKSAPDETTTNESPLNRYLALRAVRCLSDLSSLSLYRYTELIIRRVLNECLGSTIIMRSKAMKQLNGIIMADPKLLETKAVADTVMGRLRDKQPSVREAAVELVGRFMISNPEYTNRYYPEVITRLEDTGKSVRKTVIKILSEVCEAQPNNPEIPAICTSMLRRVSDESDNIRQLVQRTFEKIWFSPLPKAREGSSAFEVERERRVSLIKGVVRSIRVNNSSSEWMYDLVKNAADNDTDDDTLHLYQALVHCLKERVLEVEAKIASAAPDTKKLLNDDLLDTLLTMLLFTQAIPSIIVPHMPVLSVYLDEIPERVLVIHNVCLLLEMGYNVLDSPDSKLVASDEAKLRELLINKPWTAHTQLILTSASKCLCTVTALVTKNYTSLVDTVRKFYAFVKKQQIMCEKTKKIDPRAVSTLNRAMFILGMLVRFFDFDGPEIIEQYMSQAEPVAPTILCPGKAKDSVFEVLMFFASGQTQVRATSLNALGSVFVRYPALMAKQVTEQLYAKYLDTTLAGDLDARVLQNLKLVLEEEEQRLHALNATGQTSEEGGDVMGAYMDGDATALTGALQALLPNVLNTFFSPVPKTRLVALHVVGLCLRQGLVHPMKCIAHIIALEADSEKMIQSKSQELLKDQMDKHKGFVIPSISDGVRHSYRMRCTLNNTKDVRGYIKDGKQQFSTMTRTYALVTASGVANRRAMIREMLRVFDDNTSILSEDYSLTNSQPQTKTKPRIPDTTEHTIEHNTMQYLMYLGETITYLPFTHEDEPLAVWRAMEDIVSVRLHYAVRAVKHVLGIRSKPESAPKSGRERAPDVSSGDTQWRDDKSTPHEEHEQPHAHEQSPQHVETHAANDHTEDHLEIDSLALSAEEFAQALGVDPVRLGVSLGADADADSKDANEQLTMNGSTKTGTPDTRKENGDGFAMPAPIAPQATSVDETPVSDRVRHLARLCGPLVQLCILYHTQEALQLSYILSGEGYVRRSTLPRDKTQNKKQDKGPEKTLVVRTPFSETEKGVRAIMGDVAGAGVSTDVKHLWKWYSRFQNVVAACSVTRDPVSISSDSELENEYVLAGNAPDNFTMYGVDTDVHVHPNTPKQHSTHASRRNSQTRSQGRSGGSHNSTDRRRSGGQPLVRRRSTREHSDTNYGEEHDLTGSEEDSGDSYSPTQSGRRRSKLTPARRRSRSRDGSPDYHPNAH